MSVTEAAAHVRMFVGGDWVGSLSRQTIDSINPATGQTLAGLPERTGTTPGWPWRQPNQARLAIASIPVFERAQLVSAIAGLVESRSKTIASEHAREPGKPLGRRR
jgi:acyl-CoA reductase-like NAD-dependent aldehyde dehydrogenase